MDILEEQELGIIGKEIFKKEGISIPESYVARSLAEIKENGKVVLKAQILSGKRGKVLDMVQKGPISIVTGELPASETFTLSEEMRGQTAGKAMWNTHFKAWSEVPKSMISTAIADIRKRKGIAT